MSKQVVDFVVFGEPASKANSRRLVVHGGIPRFIKSEKALSYGEAFAKQCPVIEPLLAGDLRVEIDIHYASRRPDLDPSLILDLLQGRAYVNDRQVREIVCRGYVDKEKPRAHIRIGTLERGNLSSNHGRRHRKGGGEN